MLSEHSTSPAWSAIDQNEKTISSADYKGKWLLLYFYPENDTPGCTLEACGFRDQFDVLSKRISILGVSADNPESHIKFIQKYSLPFPLLADTDKKLIATFGVGTDFPKRVSFLINPDGVIIKIYHGFDAEKHALDIAKDLDVLGA
jgi:peroxiredoxin Q/BCP